MKWPFKVRQGEMGWELGMGWDGAWDVWGFAFWRMEGRSRTVGRNKHNGMTGRSAPLHAVSHGMLVLRCWFIKSSVLCVGRQFVVGSLGPGYILIVKCWAGWKARLS